jgi:hypothetical protein
MIGKLGSPEVHRRGVPPIALSLNPPQEINS